MNVVSLADRISPFNEEVLPISFSSKRFVKLRSVKMKLLNDLNPFHTRPFAKAVIVINIRRVRFNINYNLKEIVHPVVKKKKNIYSVQKYLCFILTMDSFHIFRSSQKRKLS